MTIERKLLGTSPSGGAADVAEVFSTDLYTGNDTDTDIVNGIDLAGEGGLVWIKSRQASFTHMLVDSEYTLGAGNYGNTASTSGNDSGPVINTFNSNGFNLDSNWYGNSANPSYGGKYVSWTFRKKKKFFDVVTWSGDNSTNRQISHSLSGPVGMIILKCTSHATNWNVFHTSLGGTKRMLLNRNNISVQTSQEYWNNTNPTSTNFTVGGSGDNNATGQTYVAYLFADNSSEDAEDQMIKCGSYTGNSSTLQDINLGWEPQFFIVKDASANGGWYMWDSMRGFLGGANNGDGHPIYANATSPDFNNDDAGLLSNGFQVADALNTNTNSYIYMAIRAPMMIEPEAATDVFAISTYSSNRNNTLTDAFYSNFPVDMALWTSINGYDRRIASRLIQEKYLRTDESNAEAADGDHDFDSNTHWHSGGGASNTDLRSWMWKRAKGYFDVVAYTGNTTAGRTVAHSLGVAPEMMWVKCRTDTTSWMVYHAALTGTKYLTLDTTAAAVTHNGNWNNTNPTDSVFTVGDGATNVAQAQIAYLFATVAGVSKVGSFTTTGSDVNVDCGFSNGARFVLIKRTDGNAEWWFWDSITAGNDSRLTLHDNGAAASANNIDPYSAGFTMKTNIIGPSGQNYIFYAIA